MEESRKRLRLSRDDFQELANKAYIYWIGSQYLTGNIKQYIDKRRRWYASDRSNAVFYWTGVFIFIWKLLITVYILPDKYLKSSKEYKMCSYF